MVPSKDTGAGPLSEVQGRARKRRELRALAKERGYELPPDLNKLDLQALDNLWVIIHEMG